MPILAKKVFKAELLRLQQELAKVQQWVQEKGLKILVIFEGRDLAGKASVIKYIQKYLSPRFCRVYAPTIPSKRQKTQWYYQRFIEHLPTAGEMVLFDRSWYNRAGVERVDGFCTQKEYMLFLRSCQIFEKLLV